MILLRAYAYLKSSFIYSFVLIRMWQAPVGYIRTRILFVVFYYKKMIKFSK